MGFSWRMMGVLAVPEPGDNPRVVSPMSHTCHPRHSSAPPVFPRCSFSCSPSRGVPGPGRMAGCPCGHCRDVGSPGQCWTRGRKTPLSPGEGWEGDPEAGIASGGVWGLPGCVRSGDIPGSAPRGDLRTFPGWPVPGLVAILSSGCVPRSH